MSLAINPMTDRPAWLAARRQGIGASEAAAACGVSPYMSPLELYLRKVGDLPDPEPTIPMRAGLALEPLIAALYVERTGAALAATQVFLGPVDRGGAPLLATLDAVRADGRPVEFKSAAWAHDLGDEGTDELPAHWLVQCHHQQLVSGADEVDLAVLVANRDLRVYTVGRDDEVRARLLTHLTRFWVHVRDRVPPPPTRPGDARLMAWLAPPRDEEFPLGPADTELADEHDSLGRQLKEFGARKDLLKAILVHRLGGAVGVLPDGRRIKHYVNEIAERTQVVKAHRSSTLRILKARDI